MSIVELPQIKNLTNEEIKVPDKCGMNNLPEGLPCGFFSMLAVGTSGSGKSNSVINLIKKLKPYYNRYVLISPTGCKDDRGVRGEPKWDSPKIDFDHEYDSYYPGLISDITTEQKECIDNYDDYQKYKAIYIAALKFLKTCSNPHDEDAIFAFKDVETLIQHDFAHYDDCPDFFQKVPPSMMLIVDDMASTPIYTYSLGELVNLQMKCRHLFITTINCIQHYTLIPRPIRVNSHVMLLFPCKSPKLVKEIAETVCNNFSVDEFIQLFNYATKDKPFHFLYLDARNGDIRKNFNTPLQLNRSTQEVIEKKKIPKK